MSEMQGIEQSVLSEANFVALYGNNPIVINGMPELPDGFVVTVNIALAMEASACKASEEKRRDEAARLKQLAKYVGHEALLPEHRWLLSQDPNE